MDNTKLELLMLWKDLKEAREKLLEDAESDSFKHIAAGPTRMAYITFSNYLTDVMDEINNIQGKIKE
jgi:hypothetical protein